MENFNVVEMLSRFRTPAEQNEFCVRWKRGDRHHYWHASAFTEDIKFKDLGLGIIEKSSALCEKKEVLKNLPKRGAHLTTATPIPQL